MLDAEPDHRWFLHGLDRIHDAMQNAHEVESGVGTVLEAALEVFACERAELLCAAEPGLAWALVAERVRAGSPVAGAVHVATSALNDVLAVAASSDAPLCFGPGCAHSVPAHVAAQGVDSLSAVAVRASSAPAHVLVLSWLGARDRWSAAEQRLLQELGRRLGDAVGQLALLRRAREVESKLTERERLAHLLQAVIDGTPDAVFVKDLALRYLLMNAAGARFLGRPVEEVLGKDDLELFTHIQFDVTAVDRSVIASGESLTQEESATAAGETRTYMVTKSAYRDADARPIGLIGIAKDITATKRLEEDLRQAQKMEAVGRLAGGVAHDFNNLLMVINNCSEMVRDTLTAHDPNRSLLGEVLRAGERAANLVRQLLALSRKQPLEPRVLNLNALLGDMHALLCRVLGAHVELHLVRDPALPLTKVDPGQFEQAILNLVVNARDAMPRGGHLTIETRGGAACDRVVVAVSDTGHGMEAATRERVFEPFFTTKPVGRGTGLGLAMVYGFVKQSGGSIELHSEPGTGTRFEIELPRTRETLRSEPAPPLGRADATATRETILLVEDEDAVRQLCVRMLLSFGYTVLEARDGQEALQVALQHEGPIHMLLTDVVLPRTKGPQVALQLKSSRPGLRVLFMSGHVGDDALLESATPLLHKPFGASALGEKLREVLDDGAERSLS
jgi:two-component system cell cycle sensor histidine kinase/response regulator CckA